MFNYWILFCFYFKFMKNKDCLARTTKRESLSYVLFIKPCDCRQDETSAVIFCLPRSLILTGNFVVVPSWKLRKKTNKSNRYPVLLFFFSVCYGHVCWLHIDRQYTILKWIYYVILDFSFLFFFLNLGWLTLADNISNEKQQSNND